MPTVCINCSKVMDDMDVMVSLVVTTVELTTIVVMMATVIGMMATVA